jgi:1-phosphofructokinase
MIVTVTLNPALDKTMVVPGFAIGRTNRGLVERIDLGGKGINVARAAGRLGCRVLAVGFLAGSGGQDLSRSLTEAGVPNDFIYVPGETRVNLKIKDPSPGTETEINQPGFDVEPAHVEALGRKIAQYAAPGTVMVFSGSLPPGVPEDVYAGFVRTARRGGARTILDTGGAALRRGVSACPDLVKPNGAEAEELLGGPIAGDEELLRAGRRLLALGPRAAVISIGAGGALGICAGEAWRCWPPSITAASSVAAGDAMVAALAYAMIGNLPFREAVRLAVAAGTATVAMSGSTVAGRDLIDEFLPKVTAEAAEAPREKEVGHP